MLEQIQRKRKTLRNDERNKFEMIRWNHDLGRLEKGSK